MRNLFYELGLVVLSIMLVDCSGNKERPRILFSAAANISELRGAAPTSVIDLDAGSDQEILPTNIIGSDSLDNSHDGKEIQLAAATSSLVIGDSVFICDRLAHCIVVADSTGNIIRKIGRYGKAPGEFINPAWLTMNDHAILVYDMGNMRVQIFDRKFEYQSSIPAAFFFLSGSIAASRDRFYVHGNVSDSTLLRIYRAEKPYDLVHSCMPLVVPRGKQPRALNALRFAVTSEGWLCVGYTCLPYLFVFDAEGRQEATIEFRGEAVKELERVSNAKFSGGGMPVRMFLLSLCLLPDKTIIFSEGRRIMVLTKKENGYVLERKIKPAIGDYPVRHMYVDPTHALLYLSTDLSCVYKFSLPLDLNLKNIRKEPSI